MAIYYFRGKITEFPNPLLAQEDGLLAIGGDFEVEAIKKAYCKGVFPWEIDPICMWYAPQPRYVILANDFKLSKRFKQIVQSATFTYTMNTAFRGVIEACSKIERKSEHGGCWIKQPFIDLYTQLHEEGIAHSFEVWNSKGDLVGGLYGLGIGKVFCGESMFHSESDASKCCAVTSFIHLFSKGIEVIDCQMHSPIMERLGGEHIGFSKYASYLPEYAKLEKWNLQADVFY